MISTELRPFRPKLPFLTLSACLVVSAAAAADPPRETRQVRGWTLHISRALQEQEPERTARAIKLLEIQLEEIIRVVPQRAREKLQQVPLFFSPEYAGIPPRAEYHPGAGWLREHGRDPKMAKGIEFTNIRIFAEETDRMPNFTLHELAHAYHDRELPRGFDNPDVKSAFLRIQKAGRYESVERHFGNGRSNSREKAYALTNPMEFFAETSEAFFSRNDFFPFTREELRRYDPETFTLLGRLWK